jgi:polyisoprenoid-binding protein YceI
MKRLLIIGILIIAGSYLHAQNYAASDAGSNIKFAIKNFGATVNGSFKGLKGKIEFNPDNLSASSINVSVDANTVNTGNESRDKHLKKEDYFNVVNYPTLQFVSVKITGKADAYTIEGKLTIKGITKTIAFPFTATAIANGYRLQGSFRLNRRDFKVGGSSWVLSDELTVSLNVSAIKQ